MPLQELLDRGHLSAAASFASHGLNSTISRSFTRRRRRYGWTGGSVSLLASRRSRTPGAILDRRSSAPATAPDNPVDSNGPSSHSLREDLERAHNESLPGARIIIARPPGIRYREAERAPLLQPAGFISQSRDGHSILGVLQRTEDVNFTFDVPFIPEPSRAYPQVMVDELRCILSYNPSSDECEVFCYSHDVVMVGESLSKYHQVKRGQIQMIEPGMWTIALPSNPFSGTFAHPRSLVEFLLLRRKFSLTVTESASKKDFLAENSAVADNDVMDMSTAKVALEETVTEFVMGTVDAAEPRAASATKPRTKSCEKRENHLESIEEERDATPDPGPFYKLQDGETAHVTTSPAGSSIPKMETSYAKTAKAYQVKRLRKIDKNTNSSVFACIHSKLPHTTVVAKALNARPKERNSIASLAGHWRSEMEMLKALDHKNVVKLLDWDARFFTVYLEHLPDSLAPYPRERTYSRSDAERILLDVSSALVYLEEQEISHNDIKPANIAYSAARGAVVLDFGLATRGRRVPRWAGGTAWYIAPEAIDGLRTYASNVWALGVTMLYVLGKIRAPEGYSGPWDFGRLWDPEGPDREAMENWLGEVCSVADEALDTSDALECVVSWMLDQDPAERVPAKDVASELRRLTAG